MLWDTTITYVVFILFISYCFRSKQTISSGFLQVNAKTSRHKRSAKHGSSLVSWGPRNVPVVLDISHARAIARASADLPKALLHWNFLGFMILWINSWCYYFTLKNHTGSLLSETDALQHALFSWDPYGNKRPEVEQRQLPILACKGSKKK